MSYKNELNGVDASVSAGEELLNAFKVASFATSSTEDDPDYWKKVIPASAILEVEQKKQKQDVLHTFDASVYSIRLHCIFLLAKHALYNRSPMNSSAQTIPNHPRKSA